MIVMKEVYQTSLVFDQDTVEGNPGALDFDYDARRSPLGADRHDLSRVVEQMVAEVDLPTHAGYERAGLVGSMGACGNPG